MPKKSKTKVITVPGDISHNQGFFTLIGILVANWSSAESVFSAMLQSLLGVDKLATAIVWHSFRHTNARLDLIVRLTRERVKHDPTLINDVVTACDNFRGFSRVRNFYCHALYSYDAENKLNYAHGTDLTYEDDPLKFTSKPMDANAASELSDHGKRLAPFSLKCWDLSDRLADALGVPRPKRPGLPPVRS